MLRYLKKQKEEEDIEIKWPFWEDLNLLRTSLQNSDEDNLVWTAEEIGTHSVIRIEYTNDIHVISTLQMPMIRFCGSKCNSSDAANTIQAHLQ